MLFRSSHNIWKRCGEPESVFPDALSYNLPAMKEKIGEKTKIVVICNPNNPTGTYVPIGELEAFADTLPEDVLLVMDEAYMEFATEPDCCSMVDYMKAHPEKPILVLRTFSKYYAMAGRLNFCSSVTGTETGTPPFKYAMSANAP